MSSSFGVFKYPTTNKKPFTNLMVGKALLQCSLTKLSFVVLASFWMSSKSIAVTVPSKDRQYTVLQLGSIDIDQLMLGKLLLVMTSDQMSS